jgi:hypothetical protein
MSEGQNARGARQLLAACISLLRRLVPEGMLETGPREVVRALMIGALSAGESIALLVDNGYWREPMALSRGVFEMMVSACLIQHEPDLHAQFRRHAKRTGEVIRQAWDASVAPRRLPSAGYWLHRPEGMVERLAQYEPGILELRRRVWQLGCSFTHCDALSLSEEYQEGFCLDVACGFSGCCLHHMASHADDLWHGGQHSAEVDAAFLQFASRGA